LADVHGFPDAIKRNQTIAVLPIRLQPVTTLSCLLPE
jgi:hypothetical protein